MEIPPLSELAQNCEEWLHLHGEIRAAQRTRRGKWDHVLHPLEVIYARIYFTLRAIRLLGFWGILTLILLFSGASVIATAPFHNKGSLGASIVGLAAGILAVTLYLRWWRRRWRRHFANPS